MNFVEKVLLENIDNPKALFVFPTDVAASRWADSLLVLLCQEGGSRTIAMNKFAAWDTFKQNSIKSKIQDKKSVPQALRKIFAGRLIAENAEKCAQGQPIFFSLIQEKWAGQAAHFTDWIAELLPQLGMWFKKTAGIDPCALQRGEAPLREGGELGALLAKTVQEKNLDGDDLDLYTLTLRYAAFLDECRLFEPAWETPPFDDNGKDCFLFFPQALYDFHRYADLLRSNGSVKIITGAGQRGGGGSENGGTFFYTNSRGEIAEAVLYIRALNERENVPWDSIVLSIPDSKHYEPYLLRELANRGIPFVKRVGKTLGEYPAGKFFRAVAACAARDFAFAALADLVLESNLPWKDSGEIKKLVDFGIRNNCISSWTELADGGPGHHVSVWDDAFSKPFGGFDPQTRHFFAELKNAVRGLRDSDSLAQLSRRYFSFRERFFVLEEAAQETDITLSRCISELTALCDLEKKYPQARAHDPFLFFTDYLSDVTYVAQDMASGVTILPYKTAACAPFDYHIILDASQESLKTVFSELRFLPKSKREKLGIHDKDASADFIELHKFNSARKAVFFCSERTFSGFAIPHSKLAAPPAPLETYASQEAFSDLFSQDLYAAENGLLAGGGDGAEAGAHLTLYGNQKKGFDEWFSRRKTPASGGGAFCGLGEEAANFIKSQYAKNDLFPGEYSVSASSLETYYSCPLKWLFKRVFAVENISAQAHLMAENIVGSVYHGALNLFFAELKKNASVLAPPENGEGGDPVLPQGYRDLLELCTDRLFDDFPCLPPQGKPAMSAFAARLLQAEKKRVFFRLEKCLVSFLSFFHGCRVAGSESSYLSQKDGYFLNGKVDCLLEDIREDSPDFGRLVIVDFKLKNMPSRADCCPKGGGGGNFQLPMYVALAEDSEKKEAGAALFFSILDLKPCVIFGAVSAGKTVIPKKEEERVLRGGGRFESIMAEFQTKARHFAGEIRSAKFSELKAEFDKCGGCDYKMICRTTYKISRQIIEPVPKRTS